MLPSPLPHIDFKSEFVDLVEKEVFGYFLISSIHLKFSPISENINYYNIYFSHSFNPACNRLTAKCV